MIQFRSTPLIVVIEEQNQSRGEGSTQSEFLISLKDGKETDNADDEGGEERTTSALC